MQAFSYGPTSIQSKSHHYDSPVFLNSKEICSLTAGCTCSVGGSAVITVAHFLYRFVVCERELRVVYELSPLRLLTYNRVCTYESTYIL